MKNVRVISKKDLSSFINSLIAEKEYAVVGVKAKGNRFIYDTLENAEDVRLDHDVTILPPKKYFLPPVEQLMNFSLEKSFEVHPTFDDKPLVIIGMHPYDIIALQQTDAVYLDEQKDDFYKKRRNNAIIIGADIQNVSERSFAASMNTHVTDKGFDLLLTDIGTTYAVTIGSEKGKKLLDTHATTNEATPADIKKIQQVRDRLPALYKKKVKLDKESWPNVLAANYQHEIWKKQADICMGCSSCTMVCPTCFCYDVRDQVSLNLKNGQRIRTWDGCLLRDFTKVASGEVFRDEAEERYRHRFFRKGNYLPQRYGFVACVGCGRCGIACLPDVADPCNLMNELASLGKEEEDAGRYFISQKTEVKEKGVIHVPRSATIRSVTPFNGQDYFFEIELDDKKPLGHQPGQFVEISVFGIGEAPFGISSPPSESPVFEIMVRKIGNVTSKLAAMKPGDKIGVRGPLGNGFDVKALEGKHLIFTSGGTGMVPMRSLINHVVNPKQRGKFKTITILYGAKQPKEITFMNDVNYWKTVSNLQCEVTVDKCDPDECWDGCIGLVTTLFPKVKMDNVDPKNIMAVVVGPPIMYKFVIKCLKNMEIPDENIIVSLERRMKCGVGKCGHCQINGIYTCKEGPVFYYNQIKNLPEAFK